MSNEQTRLSLSIPTLLIALVVVTGIAIITLLIGYEQLVPLIAGSVLCGFVVLLIVVRHRDDNVNDESGRRYTGLGLPNALSISRGAVLSLLCGVLLLSPGSYSTLLPAGMYSIAIIVDYFDGFTARKMYRTTSLGATLDVEYDSLGVLLASFLVVRSGVSGAWFLLVGLARYLFIAGLYLRKKTGRDSVRLTGSLSGRVAAGFMMGYLGAALVPAIPIAYRRTAGIVFSVLFFASFLRDWLVVSKVVSREGRFYLLIERALKRRLIPLLQIGIRLGLGICIIIAMVTRSYPVVTAGVFAMCGLMIFTGCIARGAASAALLFLMLGISGGSGAADTLDLSISVLLILIMVFGSGPYSVAAPEERLFSR